MVALAIPSILVIIPKDDGLPSGCGISRIIAICLRGSGDDTFAISRNVSRKAASLEGPRRRGDVGNPGQALKRCERCQGGARPHGDVPIMKAVS
jgi:hypothetical protein